MRRDKVASSVISSVGYDPIESLLEIEFATGVVYHYLEVPDSVYRAFVAASSKGEYFNSIIRDHYDQKLAG